jgi:glycosyltransferase involved in cell wall biosynthesis
MKILSLLLHDERFSNWTIKEKISRQHFSLQYLHFCAQKDWKPTLYTFHQDAEAKQSYRLSNGEVIKIFPVKFRFPPLQRFGNDHNPKETMREMLRDQPDLVHFHNYYLYSYPYTADFVKKKLKKPLIAQLHGYYNSRAKKGFYLPCLLALKKADRILYSYKPEERIYRKLGLTQKAIKIPVPGIDTQLFERNRRSDSTHLLYVGRIPKVMAYGEKSPFLLLHLVRSLVRLRKDVALDVVGDGPGLRYCRNLVDKLGLSNNVVFHGYVAHSDLPKYYQASALTFSPIQVYDVDGWFDGAIQESLACGTPVAAFKASAGTPFNGTYGHLLSNKMEKAALEVAALLKTPENMEQIAREGSRFVHQNCSCARVAGELQATWEGASRA